MNIFVCFLDLSGGFSGEECFDEKVTWDAEDFFDAAQKSLDRKSTRGYRLTVFRDNNDNWATASDENQNVCNTKLNQRGQLHDYRIAYKYNL